VIGVSNWYLVVIGYVRVTDLGTLHCPYMRTTSAGSTGLMQKSLKRSQSVHVFPTCAKPSSADRLSTAGVAGKCSPASAAAICPGVKPCDNKIRRQSDCPHIRK
jgi:hypothetical protein